MELALDAEAATPLQAQIVAGIRESVAAHRLSPGEKLPSIRRLATVNCVSKFTVVEAYDRLAAQGVIVARAKSGFFVAGRTPPLTLAETERSTDRPGADFSAAPPDPVWMMRQSLSFDEKTLQSACGWLPDSWLPEAGIRRALGAIARSPSARLLDYGPPLGYLPLRQQIRIRLAELEMEAPPECILVTDGASQAIDLICRHLLQPGDAVLVDDPGYFNYHAVLRAHRAQPIPVPMTEGGLDLDALERLAAAHAPKLYLANPALQNPTGLSLTPAQAHRLLTLAARFEFRIVEDDVFRDLQSAPTQRLAALDAFARNSSRVLHLGGFSKTISAALRVGFIAGPAETIRHLTDLKLATTFGNNQVSAQLVHRMLEDGSYRKHVSGIRERLRRVTPPLRRKLKSTGLRAWVETEEGMFLWMQLPEAMPDAAVLVRKAIAERIVLAPGAVFSPSKQWRNFLRINIAQSQAPRLVTFLQETLKVE